MAAVVLLHEESATGVRQKSVILTLVSERTTAREILRRRLLTDPDLGTDAVERVERGFARNAFLLFSPDRQIEDLDEEILITPGLELVFVKLTPLVGG
jgi:hypothetical protein